MILKLNVDEEFTEGLQTNRQLLPPHQERKQGQAARQPYILKADPATRTGPQKNLNFPQIFQKIAPKFSKMTQSGPNMAQNGPKWP